MYGNYEYGSTEYGNAVSRIAIIVDTLGEIVDTLIMSLSDIYMIAGITVDYKLVGVTTEYKLENA